MRDLEPNSRSKYPQATQANEGINCQAKQQQVLQYHQDYEHNTEECFELKEEIDKVGSHLEESQSQIKCQFILST